MNYKSIIDVETMAKASEATNVLVEEAGSLKKIAGSKIGGSNITAILAWYTKDENHEIINHGTNMTYDKLLEIITNHTPFLANCISYRENSSSIYNIDFYSLTLSEDQSYIELIFEETIFTFSSDGAVSVFEGGNA